MDFQAIPQKNNYLIYPISVPALIWTNENLIVEQLHWHEKCFSVSRSSFDSLFDHWHCAGFTINIDSVISEVKNA